MTISRLLLPLVIVVVSLGDVRVGAGETAGANASLIGQRLVAIEIESATPVDKAEMRRISPVRVDEIVEADPCPEIEQRVRAMKTYVRIDCRLEPRPPGVALVISLERQMMVSLIRYSGDCGVSTEQLRRAARLQEGAEFNDQVRDAASQRLRRLCVNEGYDEARIEVDVNEFAAREVNVRFRIEEGEPRRLSEIEVISPTPIDEKGLRKKLGVDVGDRYRRSARRDLEATAKSFLRSQGFLEADVELQAERVAPHGTKLRIVVDLGPHVELRFHGNEHLSDHKLTDLIDLPARAIVTDGTWRELSRRIRRAYQESGYHDVKVSIAIEPGPPKIVDYTIEEGEWFHVATLDFAGDVAVPPDVLKRVMVTGPPSWIPWREGVLLDEEFEADLKRLWFLYRRLGYQSAEIADYRIERHKEEHALEVTIVVQAGRRTVVHVVHYEGLSALDGHLPTLLTRADEPLNPEAVEGDQLTLQTALVQAGYGEAQVTSDISTVIEGDLVGATVTFVAQPGLQQRIGRIVIQNNVDTKAQVIRRELPFKEGDVLSPEALVRGQTEIYRLGLFRSVTVQPQEETEGEAVRDVAVSVLEKPPMTLQVGAGYNTRDGIRGFLEVAHNNLQGRGRRLSLRGDVNLDPFDKAAPNEYLANLGFREPRLGGSRWTFRANLIGQRATRSIDQFSVERAAFVPAVERFILPGLQIGLEVQFEDARIFDVKPDVLAFNPRDEGRLRSISLNPFLVYDGRDDPFLPNKGVYDTLRLRYAPEQLGADVPFIKLQAQHVQYVPLHEYLTFVYAARFGWAEALTGGEQVPLRERFFLGGRTTLRGFGENDVGPKGAPILNQFGKVVDEGGNPLGGDLALNLNTEMRFPLAYGVGGIVFFDVGALYLQDRPILIDDVRRSAGLGLSYATPVGPIRIDYGFKLDRRRDESVGEVHFSIGPIF